MKQKKERDLENAMDWDGESGNLDAALESMRIDEEEFFKEAGRTFVRIESATLLKHRRKEVSSNLVNHWFIYEYSDLQEVRLLIIDQHIDGEKHSFMHGKDSPVFSYQ